MIKGVLQVIPTYTMEIFKQLREIVFKLNALLKKLWWGYVVEKGKIH